MTGSRVDRIAAALGPTRCRPAKKRATAPTVEMTAMPVSQPMPEALTAAGWRSSTRRPPMVRLTAAPVQTSVVRASGPTRAVMPSEVRM